MTLALLFCNAVAASTLAIEQREAARLSDADRKSDLYLSSATLLRKSKESFSCTSVLACCTCEQEMGYYASSGNRQTHLQSRGHQRRRRRKCLAVSAESQRVSAQIPVVVLLHLTCVTSAPRSAAMSSGRSSLGLILFSNTSPPGSRLHSVTRASSNAWSVVLPGARALALRAILLRYFLDFSGTKCDVSKQREGFSTYHHHHHRQPQSWLFVCGPRVGR